MTKKKKITINDAKTSITIKRKRCMADLDKIDKIREKNIAIKEQIERELWLLTGPKPKIKNLKNHISYIKIRLGLTKAILEDMTTQLKEQYDNLAHIREEEKSLAPPKILIVLGENCSGKTRLLRLLKDWFGNQARYYSETDELPDNPDEDYLLLDNPIQEKVVGQIENLAKGRKVILALTDASKFKFSPKTRLNILKINGLETVGAGPKD